MKKKMMFLFLLFPMIFGTADLYAQVTIGSDNAPHSGAILDLQSTEKGLKLPAVSLEDVAKFQLSADEDDAVGMMVYNTNNEIAGGNGTGIYTWSGRWIFAGRNAPVEVPVSRIVITSPGNVTMVRAGDTLRLTARVLPDTASNQKLAWSVPWNSSLTAGKAVVNDTGLVVGVKPGSVTVRAAAIDGSGVSRDFALAVLPTGTATGISISSETGEYSVEVARTLQLIAAITPETAYPTAKWEITVGAENASVSANGVVTGKAIGAARVKATTMDSTSPLADSVDIAVTSIALPPDTLRISGAGTNTYLTYDYAGTRWMIENSREANATSIGYNKGAEGQNHYYTNTQAQSACPPNYSLPTVEDINKLFVYLLFCDNTERYPWSVLELVGQRWGSTWSDYGSYNILWVAGSLQLYGYGSTSRFIIPDNIPTNNLASVRCVFTGP